MKSRTVQNRITVFGELMDENGSPVLAVLTTSPTRYENMDTEFLVLNSAYGKDTKLQKFIDSSVIIYKDAKRAKQWAAGLRLCLPSESASLGSTDASVAQAKSDVNTPDRNNLTSGCSGRNPQSNFKYMRGGSIQQGAFSVEEAPARSLHSLQKIAKSFTKALGIGQAVGTRKMNNQPKSVRGYYAARAKYIASAAVGMAGAAKA